MEGKAPCLERPCDKQGVVTGDKAPGTIHLALSGSLVPEAQEQILGPGACSPVHDHGVQRGLPGLVGAPPEAHGAVALLALARRAAPLHGVQRGAPGRQRPPGCPAKQTEFVSVQRQRTRHVWEILFLKLFFTFNSKL